MTSAVISESKNSFMNFATQSNNKQEDAQIAFGQMMQGMTKDLMNTQNSMSETSFGVNGQSSVNTKGGYADQQDYARSAKSDRSNDSEQYGRDEVKMRKAEKPADSSDDSRVQQSGEDKVQTQKAEANDTSSVKEENGEETANESTYQSMIDLLLQMQTQVTQILDTDVRDMMQAMKDLDLTAADLLNPENMQQLMLTLTGEEEASLLTDEGLYDTLQQLLNLGAEVKESVQDLSKQLEGVSTEWNELSEVLGEKLFAMTGVEEPKEADSIPFFDDNQLTAGSDNKIAILENGKQDFEKAEDGRREPANDSLTAYNVKDADDSTSLQNGAGDARGNSQDANAKEETQREQTIQNSSESRIVKDYKEADTSQTDRPLFADFMNNADSANVNMVQELTQASGASNTDAGEIMKQIVDYMKTMRNGEMSEVEMQLHPSELGTIHISVASKNGMITAQFTAQDEAVKQVLENQIDVLRENLTQSGVKVEAVEVTIASHEFERNLEQQASQDEQAERQANERKKGLRRINLDFAEDGADAPMDDAEAITRDMMMRHGNSLDYMA